MSLSGLVCLCVFSLGELKCGLDACNGLGVKGRAMVGFEKRVCVGREIELRGEFRGRLGRAML